MCWRVPEQRAGGRVALTFDDGPHPEYSHQVLDRLAARSVHATFFVIGQQVERQPDVFRRILDDGHDFGIHGYVHNNFEMPGQVRRTIEVVGRFGAKTSLFRPPNGVIGLPTQLWLAARGFTTVLWSFDFRDSMRHEGKVNGCDDLARLRAGDIALLHDDNPVCVAEIDRLVDHLEANQLEPILLRELLSRHRFTAAEARAG